MVSNTGSEVERAALARTTRVEHIGQVALVLGALALACAAFPLTREIAWLAALPAVVLAVIAMSLGRGRKRYAAIALVFGWFAFAYSFAMMLWG